MDHASYVVIKVMALRTWSNQQLCVPGYTLQCHPGCTLHFELNVFLDARSLGHPASHALHSTDAIHVCVAFMMVNDTYEITRLKTLLLLNLTALQDICNIRHNRTAARPGSQTEYTMAFGAFSV